MKSTTKTWFQLLLLPWQQVLSFSGSTQGESTTKNIIKSNVVVIKLNSIYYLHYNVIYKYNYKYLIVIIINQANLHFTTSVHKKLLSISATRLTLRDVLAHPAGVGSFSFKLCSVFSSSLVGQTAVSFPAKQCHLHRNVFNKNRDLKKEIYTHRCLWFRFSLQS